MSWCHSRRRSDATRWRLRFQELESRCLLASDYCSSFNPIDVNDDGTVTALDSLIVVNELNASGPRVLSAAIDSRPPYLDVDGDSAISPRDVLSIVDHLNFVAHAEVPALVLAASLAPDSDPDGNGIVLRPDVAIVGRTLGGARVQLSGLGDLPLVVSADAEGQFRFDFHLQPGSHSLRIVAVDEFQRSVVTERNVLFGDVILDWNASLLGVIRDWTTLSNDPYTNRVVTERPPVAARNLAMVHAAMFDAINAIGGEYEPYLQQFIAPDGASPVAAAAAAAQRVASKVYSGVDERAVFEAALAEALAIVPDGLAESLGVEFGYLVGDAMIARRSSDGATAASTYTPGTDPGDWQRTFPDFLPPLLPQWPKVVPFGMTSGSQFRPAAPPALDSAEYAAAVNELQQIGGLNSTVRTADQTQIALFWADGGGSSTPPGHWNQIAADVAMDRGTTLTENARLFALLNIALADAGISSWDAKYTYNLWRPIDAIRKAATDSNGATTADANWIPLLKTPPFPTYTSGHSTFSGAAEAVLTSFFGPNIHFANTSDGHTGFSERPLPESQIFTREFDSFTEAAEEAGRSRIYGGIHFQFDNVMGLDVGRKIGSYVVAGFLRSTEEI